MRWNAGSLGLRRIKGPSVLCNCSCNCCIAVHRLLRSDNSNATSQEPDAAREWSVQGLWLFSYRACPECWRPKRQPWPSCSVSDSINRTRMAGKKFAASSTWHMHAATTQVAKEDYSGQVAAPRCGSPTSTWRRSEMGAGSWVLG